MECLDASCYVRISLSLSSLLIHRVTHSPSHSITHLVLHSLTLTRTLHSTAATVSPKVPTEPKDRDNEETASGSEDDAS